MRVAHKALPLLACLVVALTLPPSGARAQSETLSGWVGSHRLTLQARTVATSAVFPAAPAGAEFIAITEVYPESAEHDS